MVCRSEFEFRIPNAADIRAVSACVRNELKIGWMNMDATQKLAQFMEAVNRSTAAQIAQEEQEARQEAEACIREAEAQCRAEADRTIAAAKSKITAKYQKQMSQVGYQGKTAFLSRRQELLMALFGDLREKLIAFTGENAYADWLKKLLTQQPPENGGTVLMREADLALKDQLADAVGSNVTFRADPAILIGGLSVLSADGRRCCNHTLDEAFAAQLRNFYRNHKIDGGDE